MLDKLDSVPWDTLHHAYGTASDVPGLIRCLCSSKKDERDQAIYELFGNVYHQGTVFQATEHTVPFLIELLESPKTKCKSDIFGLLRGFIEGVDFLEADGRLVLNEDCRETPRTKYQELVHGVYLAICKGIQVYLNLLEDRSPDTRSGVISLLGYCAGKRKNLHSEICQHFETERSMKVRATCAFAVGCLRKANRNTLRWLENLLESKNRTLRLWAAISLARCVSGSLPDAAYAAISDGILSSSYYEETRDRMPCAYGDIANPCCVILSSRREDAESSEHLLLRALEQTQDDWTATMVATELLNLVFDGKRISRRAAIPHRPILEAIAASDLFWAVYGKKLSDSRLDHMFKNCAKNGTQKELRAFLRSLPEVKATDTSTQRFSAAPSVMAIISQKLFSKDCKTAEGELPEAGDVVPIEQYVSTNKNLEPLSQGGDLYLVTVRPGEKLWLMAVLRSPRFSRKKWRAKANVVPVVDLQSVKRKLRFVSGTGISVKKGALGMSLQTPRTLTQNDVVILGTAIENALPRGK